MCQIKGNYAACDEPKWKPHKIGLSDKETKKNNQTCLVNRLSVAASQLALNLASFKRLLISLSNHIPFIKIPHLSAKWHNWEVRRSHRNRNAFPSHWKTIWAGLLLALLLLFSEVIGSSIMSVSRNQQDVLVVWCFVHWTKLGAWVAGHCHRECLVIFWYVTVWIDSSSLMIWCLLFERRTIQYKSKLFHRWNPYFTTQKLFDTLFSYLYGR